MPNLVTGIYPLKSMSSRSGARAETFGFRTCFDSDTGSSFRTGNFLHRQNYQNFQQVFLFSDAWYLDCGFGAWIYSGKGKDNNWCSPFKSWKVFYNNSPRSLVSNLGMEWENTKHLVWGGEAAMWSEQVRTKFEKKT